MSVLSKEKITEIAEVINSELDEFLASELDESSIGWSCVMKDNTEETILYYDVYIWDQDKDKSIKIRFRGIYDMSVKNVSLEIEFGKMWCEVGHYNWTVKYFWIKLMEWPWQQ